MLTPFLPIHIPCSLLTPPSSISLSSAFKREVGEWGVKKSMGGPPYSFLLPSTPHLFLEAENRETEKGGGDKEQGIWTARKGIVKRAVLYSCQAGRRVGPVSCHRQASVLGQHHMLIEKGRREVKVRSKRYTQGEKGKVPLILVMVAN